MLRPPLPADRDPGRAALPASLGEHLSRPAASATGAARTPANPAMSERRENSM
jgi:hypothetical protein